MNPRLSLICLGVVLVSVTIFLLATSTLKPCSDSWHISCWFGKRVIVR